MFRDDDYNLAWVKPKTEEVVKHLFKLNSTLDVI